MKRQYYTVAILRTGEISWINTGVTIDLTAILTLIHFVKACCRQARFFPLLTVLFKLLSLLVLQLRRCPVTGFRPGIGSKEHRPSGFPLPHQKSGLCRGVWGNASDILYCRKIPYTDTGFLMQEKKLLSKILHRKTVVWHWGAGRLSFYIENYISYYIESLRQDAHSRE